MVNCADWRGGRGLRGLPGGEGEVLGKERVIFLRIFGNNTIMSMVPKAPGFKHKHSVSGRPAICREHGRAGLRTIPAQAFSCYPIE